MKVKALYVILAAAALLFIGCAKAPQQDIDAAKAAVEQARTAEADRYVPDQFNAAQDSLNTAMAEVERQNSKFALFRSYGNAQKMLVAAKAAGDAAVQAAAARKEEIRQEVTNTLANAATAVTDAKALLAKAPRGKEGKEALEAIQNDLTMAEGMLTDAQNLLTSGDLLSARDKANAGLEKVNALKAELQEAIDKKSMKK